MVGRGVTHLGMRLLGMLHGLLLLPATVHTGHPSEVMPLQVGRAGAAGAAGNQGFSN